MSNDFDAGKEADRMSGLAKDAIDASQPMHQMQALQSLEREYLSLTQGQRNAVALELESKNSWHSTLPTPQVRIDGAGDVVGIAFERSSWDMHKSGYESVAVSEDCVAYGDSDNLAGNHEIVERIKVEEREIEFLEIPPIETTKLAPAKGHSKKSHKRGH